MRTHKKRKQTSEERPAPASIALSPRQIALKKLYRIAVVVGAVAACVGVAVAGAWVADRVLRRTSPLKIGEAKERVFREPTINPNKPPGPAPEGMVWIPGGEFYMGDEDRDPIGLPFHLVYVDGFWMDKHEVTNEEFAKFVAATKYKTVVERDLDPKEFPKAPPELLKAWSFVFKMPPPTVRFGDLATCQIECSVPVHGACWNHPEGPKSDLKGRAKHPVVHICYDDALAYCKWAGRRLPTEAEWEFATRGGLDRKDFPWGNELKANGKWLLNIWQGDFPYENTKEDQYETTAPVGSFPPNGYGLYDTSGNVWEWCADFYQPKYYEDCIVSERDGITRNPQGPNSGFDPLEPGFPKRVQRGGSFLCAEGACERYYCGARGKGEVKSSGVHIGFRCAK